MGSVNLDNTESGADVTLSSDGTSLLLDGTAIGGGSLDLYAENYTSGTKPATTGTNAVAIGKGSSAAGTEAIAMVDGTADSQDSFAVGGIVQSAIGGYAIGKSAQVYSQYGLALGQSSLVSASSYGTAVGYQSVAGANSAVAFAKSRASGSDSLAGAIANNTTSYGAQGTNSISIGALSKATALGGTAVGYAAVSTHVASSAFGTLATTTATNQVALGGSGITARISGAYNLPTSDGTNGQVLTTDGSGAVTFADAGGGGAALYAANESSPSAQPSATGANAISIGDSSTAGAAQSFAAGDAATIGSSGTSAVALGTSYANAQDALSANISNNTSSYGATGANSIAMGQLAKSTGFNNFAQGYTAIADGNSSFAVGYQAYADDGVAMGYRAQATGLRSFGVHTNGGGATANYSTSIGDGTTATATSAVAIGNGVTADGHSSFAIGRTTNVNGVRKFAYATTSLSGNYDGSSQTGIHVLSAATTDATATALTAHSTASTDNQVNLPNNSAYAFHGTIVARQQAADGTACAAWKIEGLIRREANAGTTVLVNSATTVLDNTPSWGMALSADTTNGCLKIEATGAAATDIRWVATIHTSEVIYA